MVTGFPRNIAEFQGMSTGLQIVLRIPTDGERLGRVRPVLAGHWGETRSDYEMNETPTGGNAAIWRYIDRFNKFLPKFKGS